MLTQIKSDIKTWWYGKKPGHPKGKDTVILFTFCLAWFILNIYCMIED